MAAVEWDSWNSSLRLEWRWDRNGANVDWRKKIDSRYGVRFVRYNGAFVSGTKLEWKWKSDGVDAWISRGGAATIGNDWGDGSK
jgi:hypothetical protein